MSHHSPIEYCVAAENDQNTDTQADHELIGRLVADDSAAWRLFDARFSRLVERCITRVTGRFSALLGDDDVREIRALLYVQLLANNKHKLRTFEVDRGSRLSSWIGMLATHSTYDYLRGIRREPKRACLADAEELSSNVRDPFEEYQMQERAERVRSVLSDFSEKDQEFIALYYGERLRPEQVAERMSISVKTVYSKKHKILSRLEVLLGEQRLAA